MTDSGHRGGFQFAPQQTFGCFIRVRRGAGRMLVPRHSDRYCSDAVPVKPEPDEPTMLLLPYVEMWPPPTTDVAPLAF